MPRSLPTSPDFGQSTSLWADASGAYYVRQDKVNNTTNKLETLWFNASTGKKTYPGVDAAPLAAKPNILVFSSLFDILASNQYSVYVIGDIALRYTLYDVNKFSYTTIWVNLTKGSIFPQNFWPPLEHYALQSAPWDRRRVGAPSRVTLAGSAESIIIPEVSSAYLDLRSVLLTNTSASDVYVDIRDSVGGSVVLTLVAKAASSQAFEFAAAQVKQSIKGTSWTAQASIAVSSVHVTALYNSVA